MWLLIFVVVVLVALIIYAPWDRDIPKGVRSRHNLFYVSNFLRILITRLFFGHQFFPQVLCDLVDCDPMYAIGLLARRIYVINRPELISELLGEGHRDGRFQKSEKMRKQYANLLGTGIFLSVGDRWRQQRKFASPLFHKTKLKSYVEIFDSESRALMDVLDSNRSCADLQSYFFRVTMETFVQLGFGVKLDALDADGVSSKFASSFDYAQFFTSKSGAYGPMTVWAQNRNQAFKECIAYLDSFISDIIAERRNSEGLETKSDLLSRVLSEKMTDKDVRDWTLNFLLAGRDTTASMLSFCVLNMMRYPRVEKLMAEEVARVCGSDVEAPITWAQVKELKYLKMVMQETLRLFPPVPIEGYGVTRDCKLGKYSLQAGNIVLYSQYILARTPQVWGEDCKQFKPERFNTIPMPFTFVPFHGGPRLCLGQEMAYIEGAIVLARLLQRFRVTPSGSYDVLDIPLKAGVILTLKNGLPVNLSDRG